MSGFFGSSEPTRWGGLLKQAISNVETTFDTLLEQQENQANSQSMGNMNNAANRSPSTANNNNNASNGQEGETETETYVDPISGMVTTVQRKKSSKPQQQQQQQQQQKEKQPLQQKPQHIPKRSESPSQGSGPNSPANSTSDLSARLAAVMADRNSTKSMSRTSSLSSVSGRQERTSTDGAVGSPKVGEAKAEKKEEIQETTQAGEEPEKVEESETTSLIEDKEGAMKVNSESESEATKSDGDNVDDTKSTEETSPIETTSIVPVASPDPTQQPESNENEDKNKDDTIKKDGEFGDTVDLSTTPLAPPTDTEEISATTDDPEKTVEGLSSSTEKSKSQDTILQQREEQLFQAMQNIAKLHDQIHTLQEEAEKQSAERKSTQTHLEELEKQLKATNRSSVGADQKNVKKLESTIEDLRQQLATKSEQAQALMEEGEKLSKTELKHMTAIKKLRAEKQEQEKNAAELQKKIDRTASDLIEANGKIMKANELEKRLQEKVKVLLDMTERQTKHINKLEIELRSLREQKNQAEMALKDAMENLEAERDKIHAKSKEAHAAMLEKEVKAGEKLREELTSVREGAEAKETRLHEEIRELQAALQSSQNTSGEREDTLRNEVSELQQRIRELESSTEDIDSTVAEATASLLEQIESLQKQHSVAIKNRDQNEQGIILRLQTAELERDQAKQKLKETTDNFNGMSERLEQAERELAQEKRDTAKERAEYEADRATVSSQKEELENLRKELEELKAKEDNMEETIKKRYQKLMKERLQEEKNQLERKYKTEHANSLRKLISKQAEIPATVDQEDASNDGSSTNESQSYPKSNSPVASPRSSSDNNSYSGITNTTTATSNIMVDRFQSNMRRMENQLSFYQTQLESTTQSRDELSEEVLNMTVEIENLRKETKRVQELETELRDLNQRYHASLELLGERTEQVEELKADIADVKEMYRNQIVELVQKIGSQK